IGAICVGEEYPSAEIIGNDLSAIQPTCKNEAEREPCPGPRLEGWIRDAGFTSVVHRKFRLPLGSWPKDPQLKDIGMCNIAQLLEGLEAFSLKIFCGVLGMPMDEVLVMLAQTSSNALSHVVYGQKP
ncbi:hypothetical protein FOXB_16910, partial [Fusarium oxysporum f. sp. conglutinans Fo5176]